MTKIRSVASISPDPKFRSKLPQRTVRECKPVDSKVQELVLPEIQKSGPNTLLVTASSPQVIIDLIPEMTPPILSEEPAVFKEFRKPTQRQTGGKYIPLGIHRCDESNSLNALMQLILFLPGFRELFSFAPRSLASFAHFIDRYLADQLEGHLVSSADPRELVRCLAGKISPKMDILELLFALVEWAFPPLGPLRFDANSIALHPDWQISWDFSIPFLELIEKSLSFRPPELFVSIKNHIEPLACQLVERQFFAKSDAHHCYELDAFLEYRPDGPDRGHYVAYLKMDGIWYQCDDERVTSMRSTSLNVPLHRSVLLHYKRIDLLRQTWK